MTNFLHKSPTQISPFSLRKDSKNDTQQESFKLRDSLSGEIFLGVCQNAQKLSVFHIFFVVNVIILYTITSCFLQQEDLLY